MVLQLLSSINKHHPESYCIIKPLSLKEHSAQKVNDSQSAHGDMDRNTALLSNEETCELLQNKMTKKFFEGISKVKKEKMLFYECYDLHPFLAKDILLCWCKQMFPVNTS